MTLRGELRGPRRWDREIEAQHELVAELRGKAHRVSADGMVFDVGDQWYVSIHSAIGGPTPRGSSVLYQMAILPISAEDVDDHHGGWA